MKKRIVEIYQNQRVDGEMVKVLIGLGTFHGWGFDVNEDYAGSSTTAIVELPDGTVRLIYPTFIRFQSPEDAA